MLVHRTKPSYRNQSLGGREGCIDIMSSRVLHLLSFWTVASFSLLLGKNPDLKLQGVDSNPSSKTTTEKRSTSLSMMIKWHRIVIFCPFSVQKRVSFGTQLWSIEALSVGSLCQVDNQCKMKLLTMTMKPMIAQFKIKMTQSVKT